jgi:ABC-type amino acid transport system permease subunit
LLSVPAGQVEAADALGLSRFQTMFRVTLPQAFRVSLPALGNEFASVIKDTSLISAIGALELSFRGTILVRGALKLGLNHVFIIWVEVALLYFVLTTVVTIIVRKVENRSKVPGLEAASL